MIMLSLNWRGVEGALKQKSLKMIFVVYNIDVVMLQETMCIRLKVVYFLSYFIKDWEKNLVDTKGFEREVVRSWIETLTQFLPIYTCNYSGKKQIQDGEGV